MRFFVVVRALVQVVKLSASVVSKFCVIRFLSLKIGGELFVVGEHFFCRVFKHIGRKILLALQNRVEEVPAEK